MPSKPHVVVVGAGFCGLAAAYELGKQGIKTTVLEQDDQVGGLASSFSVDGVQLEKFYHHWFTSDTHVISIVKELGKQSEVLERLTRTGMYYSHNFFRLATPLDVLRFSPLPFIDRLRLALLVPQMSLIRDWQALERQTAADWVKRIGGERVYRVVWQPLLQGKFGELADKVSAAWLYSKLKLRGGSRSWSGKEKLLYYRGGFAALAESLAAAIYAQGGKIKTGVTARSIQVNQGRVSAVLTSESVIHADAVIATPALPIIAGIIESHVPKAYLNQLRSIKYLANVCVVLELKRSLSDTYWLNVNDPSFPFVGVIEHTNLEPTSSYHNRHIVYLSRYLPAANPFYTSKDKEVVRFTLKHLRRMFPDFDIDWLLKAHVWKARYAQPVVECNYRSMLPSVRTPITNFFIATMAQVYPEDRGTNYAIKKGREVAKLVTEVYSPDK